MGITQYQLRRPGALRGEVAVTLPEGVRLAIIAETLPEQQDALLNDILRALRLSLREIVLMTPQQWLMLGDVPGCPQWRLGGDAGDALLHTPPLTELYHNPAARRHFWQQICHHESHFFTHRG